MCVTVLLAQKTLLKLGVEQGTPQQGSDPAHVLGGSEDRVRRGFLSWPLVTRRCWFLAQAVAS